MLLQSALFLRSIFYFELGEPNGEYNDWFVRFAVNVAEDTEEKSQKLNCERNVLLEIRAVLN